MINNVCQAVREALSEEGYDDHTLQELRTVNDSFVFSSQFLFRLVMDTTIRKFQSIRTTIGFYC